MGSRRGGAAVGLGMAAVLALPASAEVAVVGASGMTGGGSFLQMITRKLELAIAHIPTLGVYLANLPQSVGGRISLLLLAIVAAGLAAEYVVRLVLAGFRRRAYESGSPVTSFFKVLLLDLLALAALWIVGRAVLAQIGDGNSVGGRLGHVVLITLLFWRGFNLLFRAWLRPGLPAGRMAPVDDATARRLLVGLNLMIVLPVMADVAERFMQITGATDEAMQVAEIIYVPLIAVGLMAVVWSRRFDVAAWLTNMLPDPANAPKLKLDLARNWWIPALVFYGATGLAEVYAALAGNDAAPRGMDLIETVLIALLLFETLMYRVTRHIVSELPMAGDVVADCARLAVRLFALIMIVEAVVVQVLAVSTAESWAPQDRNAKIAALTAVAVYALWRFLRYRMDSYIAANPLPSADVAGDSEDEVRVAASRLRTLMPLLRVVAGAAIAVIGGLLVLSELGINITPLIAGASVFGLAVSFGSQSLVRDIVSGVFFLAEDSFRIGEYVDCSKVKGVVEGFSVRSLKLRHQNGQLHIVPFGQVGHITNFSRDWTVVKFNLAFANGTDVELLRKTVKKIGVDMMQEPQFKPILMQPLKMQGVVDIKDNSLIVRFKFMARPKNPSMVQRMAVRRMYEQLPALGIQFATPTYPFAIPAGPAPASAPAAPPPSAPPTVKAAE